MSKQIGLLLAIFSFLTVGAFAQTQSGSTTISVGTNQGTLTFDYCVDLAPYTGNGPGSWTNFSYAVPSIDSVGLYGDSITYTPPAGPAFPRPPGGYGYNTTINGQPISGKSSTLYFPNTFPVQNQACTLAFQPEQSPPYGSASLSCTPLSISTFDPLYKITSILYSPPGNESKNGFSTSVSNGTTTSISNTFANSNTLSITASGGLLLASSTAGVSVGYSASTIDTSSFQCTTQSTSGSEILSSSNLEDHTQDQIFLWLNPQVSIAQTGSSTLIYTMSNVGGKPPDIINTRVANLQHPSQIPLWKLVPQTPVPGGVTLPGLEVLCANPLPPSQCTQTNACGCVPSDFAAIITAADPFFSPAALAISSSPTPDQVNQVDSNRFVYLQYLQLEDTQKLYGFSDTTQAFQSWGNGNGYSVGYTVGGQIGNSQFFGSISLTDTNTFTWSNTKTVGSINGTANSINLTLGTTNSDCGGYVDIYEDTVYHTFVPVREEPPPPGC